MTCFNTVPLPEEVQHMTLEFVIKEKKMQISLIRLFPDASSSVRVTEANRLIQTETGLTPT